MTDVYDIPEPDLHVPESSLWRAEKLFDSDPERDYAARVISAPIVAAELRRLADAHHWGGFQQLLLRRADELDGGAR